MKIVGFILVEDMRTYYRGVDRDPWHSLSLAFYRHQLSDELALVYDRIQATTRNYAGIKVATTASDFKAVASWAQEQSITFDALAIGSSELESRQGSFNAADSHFERLGYDVAALGEWSLVRAGVFDSQAMAPWRTRLNSHGLFDDASLIGEFIEEYKQLMAQEHVEPLALGPYYPIDIIEVNHYAWSADSESTDIPGKCSDEQ